MINIVILGNGAREYSISRKFSEDNKIDNIYIYPSIGNDAIYTNKIKPCNYEDSLSGFVKRNNISFIFVGSEIYFGDWMNDPLIKDIHIFAPSLENCKLETCKIYGKKMMEKFDLSTPNYKVYSLNDKINNIKREIFEKMVNECSFPIIKEIGLAGGKGVYIPNSIEESMMTIDYLKNKVDTIMIEDKIEGEECSLLGFCNGETISFMPQCRDYKKRYNNDYSLNTGGMGSILPIYFLCENELEELQKKVNILVKTLNYKGILYLGLMRCFKTNKIYILEFNCRFGDPECQILMEILNESLYNVCMKCLKGDNIKDIKWKKNITCMNISLVSLHYPFIKDKLDNPIKININSINEKLKNKDIKLCFYKSQIDGNNLYIKEEGRLISLVGISTFYEDINEILYSFLEDNKNELEGLDWRTDIQY
jgi:phosphoribosylamine--glycine ligase